MLFRSMMINGIDRKELHSNHFYKLDDEQFDILLNQVFKKSSKYEAEKINRFSELAINYFSIDIQGKQYVVAYRKLSLNFKNRTLKMDDRTTINKSFLIEEDKKVTLGMYLDRHKARGLILLALVIGQRRGEARVKNQARGAWLWILMTCW